MHPPVSQKEYTRVLAKLLEVLHKHSGREECSKALLQLYKSPSLVNARLRDVYRYQPRHPLFPGGSLDEGLAQLHATSAWRKIVPVPSPEQAFAHRHKLIRDFIASRPERTLSTMAEYLTCRELLAVRGLGPVSAQEIRQTFIDHGFLIRDF